MAFSKSVIQMHVVILVQGGVNVPWVVTLAMYCNTNACCYLGPGWCERAVGGDTSNVL